MAPTDSKKMFMKENMTSTNFMKSTQSRMSFIEALKLEYSENNHDQKEKEKMMIQKDARKYANPKPMQVQSMTNLSLDAAKRVNIESKHEEQPQCEGPITSVSFFLDKDNNSFKEEEEEKSVEKGVNTQ